MRQRPHISNHDAPAAPSRSGDRRRRFGLRPRLTVILGLMATALVVLVATAISRGGAPGLAVLWAVAGLATGWIGSWGLTGWLLAPMGRDLRTLAEACRGIDGDTSEPPPVPRAPTEGHQGMAELFDAFEAMAEGLGSSREELRSALAEGERLRSELEEEVASRDEEIRRRTLVLEEVNLDLERLAREDGLTGIANHRRFMEFSEQCWRICAREQQPVALLMADVDRFKAYNDIYGHQAGDQCLKQVSRAMADIARRPLDLAARYGGEEFSIVLGHVDLDDAWTLGEQLRRSVEDLRIPHSGSPDYGVVTVSVGVASVRPERGTEVSTLIAMADRALYLAKSNGRNRTERSGVAGR
ncbi:MAG: diguanylate cyclase [Acidobacteriota bacterium]